ncbi:MAG TPA: hypothetical protein VGG44_06050 [Tepidisphaeraceae bacterium]|jgi:hypothetical protein
MNQDKPKTDSEVPVPDASPKRIIPAWARAPIFMYVTMVTAFLIVGIFVVYHVIRLSQSNH